MMIQQALSGLRPTMVVQSGGYPAGGSIPPPPPGGAMAPPPPPSAGGAPPEHKNVDSLRICQGGQAFVCAHAFGEYFFVPFLSAVY